MTKVLVVATSRKTRGGITSVVQAHERGEQWKRYHCRWIETHRDKDALCKLWYVASGFIKFCCLLLFYDIVHIHASEPPSALRKCFFMWWARLWRKKTIVHFHAFSPETTVRSKHWKLYRYLFSNADVVIVLSEVWKGYVNDVFRLGEKVRVVYNPCTSEILPGEYVKKKRILYAGTVNGRKGYTDMIKAFAKVAGKFPDWEIVFAGNGEIEEGTTLAAELGITQQTVFLGWVNGADKDKAFKEASIFCLPSYAEGFPMAVLDAWAYGLPVITTPVGGIPDIAEDGHNMLLFQPGDIEALSRNMEKLITDLNLRQRIAAESVRLSQVIFNIDTVNSCLEDIYKELSL